MFRRFDVEFNLVIVGKFVVVSDLNLFNLFG